MNENPKVFISYTHDSREHADKILSFSNSLRSEGIDTILDQYETSPSEGWPRWMDRQVRNADFVLMVCTPTYFRRVMGEEKEGVGLGGIWEGNLIYQHLYNNGMVNNNFIPILFDGYSYNDIPTPLQGATHYYVDVEANFDKLYWRLRNINPTERPALGKLRPLPEKERKSLFISSFIDIEKWDRAKWSGIAFILDPSYTEPPRLVLLFKSEKEAKEIFEEWISRIGRCDSEGAIRISIVEGDVPNEDDGYYVHIGTNIESAIERAKKQELDIHDNLFLVVSRFHRMNPLPESRNLENFKLMYEKFGSYFIMPSVIDESLTKFKYLGDEFKMLKKGIIFRNVDEIFSEHDEDAVLLPKYRKS